MQNASERKIVVNQERNYNKTAREDQITPGKEFPIESDGQVKLSEEPQQPQDLKKKVSEEEILQGYLKDKPMTFREDLYSLLFVSLVKPQYKMYCDILARTGEKMPFDLHHPIPSVLAVDTKNTLEI